MSMPRGGPDRPSQSQGEASIMSTVLSKIHAWILGPEPFVWVTSVNGEKIKTYPHRNLSVSGERLPSPRDPWRELDKGC